MLDCEEGDVHSGNHLGRWRRLRIRIYLIALATASGEKYGQSYRQQANTNCFAVHVISCTFYCSEPFLYTARHDTARQLIPTNQVVSR
jgi:hypothetical protein